VQSEPSKPGAHSEQAAPCQPVEQRQVPFPFKPDEHCPCPPQGLLAVPGHSVRVGLKEKEKKRKEKHVMLSHSHVQ